ncbi:hypothetical protein [Rhodococcoides kroppenstedtii]|nr:hypothetical protein [Rhodococcus kroppenstedtii]MBY6312495.1 hypothetical protein [Rhodococcus kroppenstedtii]MBY6398786.1 hypothetical protein [Rhodococcus kroppenstedtii]
MLDSLEAVHGAVTKGRRGRQRVTSHYNLTMLVALAAEFQGFARDLHDECAIALVDSLTPGNDDQITVLLPALTNNRKLDTGNANPSVLGSDFLRFGMSIWDELEFTFPSRKADWNLRLETLNKVRNAVAHSNEDKLADLKREHLLTLAVFRKWRREVTRCVAGMDRVCEAYLRNLTGVSPW